MPVGHYLWGIDTRIPTATETMIAVGHYLWGIDTQRQGNESFPNVGRTLPMRNWHVFTHDKYLQLCLMVGHYLWGIDTNKDLYKSPLSLLQKLSDITYEELTLSSSFLIVDSLIFSRTLPMRNWHSHVLSFIKFLILSDITYEELTRLSGIVKVSPFSMKCGRTLPMRNWHSPKIVIIECFILCRTLPMRNWHKKLNLTQLFLLRRTLPMRNWH